MKFLNNVNSILLVFAHPDDEVLACGGLIAKFSKDIEFNLIFISEGDSCRFEDYKNNKAFEAIHKERTEASYTAAKLLGINEVKHLNYPCGRLDSINIIDINKKIEEMINSYNPQLIITHFLDDNNNDHRIVSRSVHMAARPVFEHDISIMEAEVLSSTDWNYSNTFSPNLFVKLSDEDIEIKKNALKCYDKEIRSKPHSRSSYGIEALSRYRGLCIGHEFAEGYILKRHFL